MYTAQSTTVASQKPRRTKSVYVYKTLDTTEAKQRLRLPFVPETAYSVTLNGAVLGIVVYHRVMKDWFAEGCITTHGLRHAFGKRELAAKGLRILAEREHRI